MTYLEKRRWWLKLDKEKISLLNYVIFNRTIQHNYFRNNLINLNFLRFYEVILFDWLCKKIFQKFFSGLNYQVFRTNRISMCYKQICQIPCRYRIDQKLEKGEPRERICISPLPFINI